VAFAEWTGIAAPYARSFGALCACTIPAVLAELSGSGRLLDVGTGTGNLAVAAAQAGWQVDAFDAEQTMIDYARDRTDASGIRFTVARLPELSYPDAGFDAIAANFAINHVDEPRASLAELRRTLRPGGRFAATVWPWGPAPTATALLWREIQDETGAYPPPGNRLPAGSDFDRTEEGLAGLLEDGGFADVTARRVHFTWRIDADELWSGVEAGIALIGYAYTAADEATRARMRAAYDARTPMHTDADGLLRFEMSAVLASGRR
jgi:SAM-dependent methyltransferase